MTRFKVTKTVQIKAPIESVFEAVSDPENLLRLNLMPEGSLIKPHQVERITKEPVGRGSVWHFRGSFNRVEVEYDEQVMAWDPPRRLVTEEIGGPFRAIRWEHRLSPMKSGTRETHTVVYEPPDSFKRPVERKELRRQISRNMDAAMGSLKRFLEGRKANRGEGEEK